jgi:nucleoside-diphosphate-sugar epimerase
MGSVMASNSTDRFLVTGGLGCIGAWVAHELLAEGACVQICDVGGSRHRIEQLVAPDAEGLSSSALDITDSAAVARCFDIFRPTHVFHLAALQVPFCKADPVLGASVNVVGTVVLMEAMAERLPDRTFVYANLTGANLGGRTTQQCGDGLITYGSCDVTDSSLGGS